MRRTKTVKLTAGAARTLPLPEGKSDHFYWDTAIPGLCLRVREGGSRTLVFAYEFGGRARKISLGAATVDFEAARERARRFYGRLLDGRDPATERDDAQRQAAETFAGRLRDFLTYMRDPQGGGCRPRYCREVERYLLVAAQPLHNMPLAQIEARDVAALASTVATNSGPDAARVTPCRGVVLFPLAGRRRDCGSQSG